MAETTKAVKAHEALALDVTAMAGATLPQCITAAIGMARKLGCLVRFTWGGKIPVVVSQDDTYQGVQRKVGRQKAGK